MTEVPTPTSNPMQIAELQRCDSMEFKDAIVDEDYMQSTQYRAGQYGGVVPATVGAWDRKNQSKEHKELIQRVEQHELEELQTFIAQKLFRVDNIICDEQTRIMLIEKLVATREYPQLSHDEYVHKYGSLMAGWLRDKLVPSMSDCTSVLKRAAVEFYKYKASDPLCNWGHLPTEQVEMVVQRIANFSQQMTARVRYSLLVEPGKFSCHLTDFISEYRRLERILVDNDLTPEENAQAAFNANYLTKARSKLTTCCDMTRVKLKDGKGNLAKRSSVMSQLFDKEHDLVQVDDARTYGTGDFIHASYVQGGPLMNTFICAQAPLKNTQEDFWRMVYQERSQMIVMLCAAVDPKSLGELDNVERNLCPYYWPRVEGTHLRFHDFEVTCISVDAKTDPLFTITKLSVKKVHDDSEFSDDDRELIVDHYQWDWQFLGDFHWPFRILRRARQLPTPTIIQCIDGCARSGTLVAIETALMHFIRGFPQSESVVLQACVFVRMQRRHSVPSMLHFLFIYRVLLRWIEPYVSTFSERVALGLRFKSFGFIPKYDSMVREHTRMLPPY